MIIDMHTHTFPDAIAERAVGSLAQASGTPPCGDGTDDALIAEMRRSGTDYCLSMPVATKPEQVSKINRKSKNHDGIIFGGAMHPEYADYKAELAFLKDNGFTNIKLHPEYQSFSVTDRKYFPLYEAISESGICVTFHAGADGAYKPPYHSNPRDFEVICRNFPDLKIILAHYGSFQMWDEVLSDLSCHDNLYLDTGFIYKRIGGDIFDKILKKFGSEHILYATDWPWESQVNTLDMLRSKNLPQSDLDLILGENAARILKLK